MYKCRKPSLDSNLFLFCTYVCTASHAVQEVSIGRSNKQSELVCLICSFAINTTAIGCQFIFTPALDEQYHKVRVNREDKQATRCFKIPEEIVGLEVEVFDVFLDKEIIEPAWRSSSVSVPACKQKILTIIFVCTA